LAQWGNRRDLSIGCPYHRPIGTHYDRLGVAPDATADELRRAYRRRARALHPDAGHGDGSAMAELNEAWTVLSDPDRRADYDRGLTGQHGRRDPEDGDPVGVADLDDGVGPQPAHRRRAPVLTIAVLAVLGVVFVGSAYARTGGSEAPPGGPLDGLIEPGSCVQVLPGDLAEETPCSGPNAGVASAVLAPGSTCPAPTAAFIDRRLRTVCVRPG
jgi:hypothetical protein